MDYQSIFQFFILLFILFACLFLISLLIYINNRLTRFTLVYIVKMDYTRHRAPCSLWTAVTGCNRHSENQGKNDIWEWEITLQSQMFNICYPMPAHDVRTLKRRRNNVFSDFVCQLVKTKVKKKHCHLKVKHQFLGNKSSSCASE